MVLEHVGDILKLTPGRLVIELVTEYEAFIPYWPYQMVVHLVQPVTAYFDDVIALGVEKEIIAKGDKTDFPDQATAIKHAIARGYVQLGKPFGMFFG